MAKTSRKSAKAAPQLRSRTTRSRGKALANPVENTQLLTEQLRALGLYAASTLGDGNCLFRALSDQLYGTESYHLKLRQEVCNWIEAHKIRYEPFVDDERGLDVHLQCMRQQATYGGHLELSAFAHMIRRNVKVIQPGLVYVIEWEAGWDFASERSPSPEPSNASHTPPSSAMEAKLKRKERKRLEKAEKTLQLPTLPVDENGNSTTVYVAYHDWEHFSSIRNLRGPHSGLPNVKETPIPGGESSSVPTSPVRKKPASRALSRPSTKPTSKIKVKPLLADASLPVTPSQVPLPLSRSISPTPEDLSSQSTMSSQLVMPYPLPSTSPSRTYRSPKRTFDESSASSESSQSAAKRVRSATRPPDSKLALATEFDEADMDTPPLTLSAPGSPSSMSSLSSISSSEDEEIEEEMLSPPPPPPPPQDERSPTRRQRKRLGLLKTRAGRMAKKDWETKASAGKIVIPGGRFKKDHKQTEEEWQKNGTGRVDVRGFRELKI